MHREDSPVNVGTYDCTSDESICVEAHVVSYPTIVYQDVEAGVSIVYKLHRSLQDLLFFIHSVARPVLTRIPSEAEIKKFKAEKEIFLIFVVADSVARPEEYKNVHLAATKHAKDMESFIVSSSLVKTKQVPGLVIVKNGKLFEFGDEWTVEDISKWIIENRFAAWHQLTKSLFFEFIVDPREMFAVVLLDDSKDNSGVHTVFPTFYKSIPSSFIHSFFWVDISTWPDLMKVWGLTHEQLPQIAVFNPRTQQHYLAAGLGTDSRGITKEAVIQFLDDVVNDKVTPHGGKDISARLQSWFYRFVEIVGFSAYSLQAEWPLFFKFLVAIFLFLAIRLVAYVFVSNRRRQDDTKVNALSDPVSAAAMSPAVPEKSVEEKKKQ